VIKATRLLPLPVFVMLVIAPAFPQLQSRDGLAPTDPLGALAQRVASRAAAEFASSPVGALSVAVVADGRVIGTSHFGHADGEEGPVPTGATLYRIGSMTKTFTALMLLQLENNDRCYFSDPVERYLPQFADIPNPPPTRAKVTLIQLATHTAALAREPKDAAEFESGPLSDWEQVLLRAVPKTSFIADPGSVYSYSNLGYAYLGLALGKAAGIPYTTYVTQNILQPLGMRETVFEVGEAMRPRLARGHVVADGVVSTQEPWREHAGRGYRVPNGGLYSTLDDMTRWLRFQMGEAAPGVFDPEALARAQRRITLSGPGLDDGYGIGLQTRRIGETVLFGHSGGVAGYQGEFFFEPRSKVGVVVLRSAIGGGIDIEAIVQSAFVLPPQARAIGEPRDLAPIIAPVLAAGKLPALGGAIVTSDGLEAIGALGLRAWDGTERVTPDDQWHLGSCTKALTATLAARLIDRGVLAWDTTIGSVFGASTPGMDPAWKQVPITWLLCHRSGASLNLQTELWERIMAQGGLLTEQRRAFVREGLSVPPDKQPGTETVYSNAGFVIAAAMLEKLTGASWEALMAREVFEPLGMTRTGFGPPGRAGALEQPLGHTRGTSGWSPVPLGPMADIPPAGGPAGNVHTTLADWAQFAQAHLRGAHGDESYLKQETWAALHSAVGGGNYSPGWVVSQAEWAGGTLLSHLGSNGYWVSQASLAPDRDLAVLTVTNVGDDAAEIPFKQLLDALIANHAAHAK